VRFPPDIEELATQVISLYTREDKKICTAESCTGGLIAATLTSVAGSSAVLERGFVSYSHESKTELLGVLPEKIERFGIVSGEIAEEMAQGALDFSQADVALSITGIAGPDGGTNDTPVGLVYLGVATREGAQFHLQCNFSGTRDQIRHHATAEALKLLISLKTKEK